MSGQSPLGGAYSGRIIGEVVKALDLDLDVLSDRTAARFFSGKTISEAKQKKILLGLGQALVELGIVPPIRDFEKHGFTTAEAIAEAADFASIRWDALLAMLQSHSAFLEDSGLAIERFLRLIVVDLALRIGAALRLAELKPTETRTPSWAEENAGGMLLRSLAEEARLTRETLAELAAVSDNSIDNWLDGKTRPNPEHTSTLARLLGERIRGTRAEGLETSIRREFALAHISDLLTLRIGRESVIELSSAMFRFARLVFEDLKRTDRPPVEGDRRIELAALWFGTAHPSTYTLIFSLFAQEPDEHWQRDIFATTDWTTAFQEIAAKASGGRAAAGLAQDVSDLMVGEEDANREGETPAIHDPADAALRELAIESSAEDYLHALMGDLGQLKGKIDTGLAVRRRISREFPLSARAHFELGSFLGKAGKSLNSHVLVDEGITECKIAATFMPNWDAPAVEPGIILINCGEFKGALVELEWANDHLQNATPHLLMNKAYALLALSRYAEALSLFESVVRQRPQYALASLYAAHCAFRLRDKRKGSRYAKSALRLGEPAEYIAWRSGEYSTASSRQKKAK